MKDAEGVAILRRVTVAGRGAAFALACVAGAMGCGRPPPPDTTSPRLPELLAPRVATPPLVDGRGTDPAWFGAGRLDIPTTGGPTVHVRAVLSQDQLYLLARWPDATETLGKAAWYFDGVRWHSGLRRAVDDAARQAAGREILQALAGRLGPVPRPRRARTQQQARDMAAAFAQEDEDRFALLWPIADSMPQFRTSGCATACHTEDPDRTLHDMWTNGPEERADLWHWKSARTNPAGWADDRHLTHLPEPARGGGRRADPDSSPGYARNETADRTAPAFGYTSSAPEADTRAVLSVEAAVPLAQAPAPQAGDVVPAYVVTRPRGNRGDVRAAGRWMEGHWTLELRRPLETGNAEDVQFTAAGTYPFGLAVMDNGGGAVHTTAGPLALRIPPPVRAPAGLAPLLVLLGTTVLVGGFAALRAPRA